MPNSCENLLEQAGVPENMRSFDSLNERAKPGSPMASPSPIFPKIEISGNTKRRGYTATQEPVVGRKTENRKR